MSSVFATFLSLSRPSPQSCPLIPAQIHEVWILNVSLSYSIYYMTVRSIFSPPVIYLFIWTVALELDCLNSLIPSHGRQVHPARFAPHNFLEAKFTTSLAQEAFWNLSFVWGVFEKEICHHQIRFREPTQNVWHGSNSSFLVPLRFVYYFENRNFHKTA